MGGVIWGWHTRGAIPVIFPLFPLFRGALAKTLLTGVSSQVSQGKMDAHPSALQGGRPFNSCIGHSGSLFLPTLLVSMVSGPL